MSVKVGQDQVESSYKIKDTWLMEYFLNKHLWGKGVMTGAIRAILQNMQEQEINDIGAIVDRRNYPSIKVLENSGFKKISEFDLIQDYYKI